MTKFNIHEKAISCGANFTSAAEKHTIKANFMPRKITHSENQAYPPKQSDHTVHTISSMLFQRSHKAVQVD